MSLLPDGYDCPCGTRHTYAAYVYAHWDFEMNHKCENCGRTNVIEAGEYRHTVEDDDGIHTPEA